MLKMASVVITHMISESGIFLLLNIIWCSFVIGAVNNFNLFVRAYREQFARHGDLSHFQPVRMLE